MSFTFRPTRGEHYVDVQQCILQSDLTNATVGKHHNLHCPRRELHMLSLSSCHVSIMVVTFEVPFGNAQCVDVLRVLREKGGVRAEGRLDRY